MKKRAGIGYQISKMVTISVLSAMTLLSLYLTGYQVRQELAARRAGLEANAYVLASSVAEQVESNNRNQVLHALRSISRIPDVLYAAALDKSDVPVATMGSAAYLQDDLVTSDAGFFSILTKGTLPVSVDIVRSGGKIGRLVLIGYVRAQRKRVVRLGRINAELRA